MINCINCTDLFHVCIKLLQNKMIPTCLLNDSTCKINKMRRIKPLGSGGCVGRGGGGGGASSIDGGLIEISGLRSINREWGKCAR